MADFDKARAWEKIRDLWFKGRTPKDGYNAAVMRAKREAHAAFERHVHDHALAVAVWRAAKAVVDQTPAGQVPTRSLAGVMRGVPAWPENTDDRVGTAFAEVWGSWVHSKDFPENELGAASLFRQVAKKHGLDDVVEACRHYTRCVREPAIEGGRTIAWGMKFFLDHDGPDPDFKWWQVYLHRARNQVPDEVLDQFKAVWSWYPRKTAAQGRQALDLWLRCVPEQDRFKFWCAVREYRSDRSGEDEEFTLGILKFIASWRDRPWRVLAARALTGLLMDHLPPARTAMTDDTHWVGVALWHITKNPDDLGEAVVQAVRKNGDGTEAEAAIRAAVQERCQLLCRTPRGVIPSYSRAPRTGDPDPPPPAGGVA